MKALVYTGTGRISLRDEPEPPARNGEVIVRIQACGICGSDMHAYHGQDPRRMPPMILGHEAVGVAESGYHAGKQVVINPLTTCGDCSHCRAGRSNLCSRRNLIGLNRPGAFAERVAVLERNLLIVPDGTELTRAVLTEPTACAVHAVGRNSLCPLTETRALVLGGGAIGLLSASVLKNYGCDDIALGEVWESRRVAIDKLGIGHTYDPFDHKARQQAKFDLVIDAVGSGKTRQEASQRVAPGGVIVHVGLQDSEIGLDIRRVTLQEVTIVGAYTYSEADFLSALQLLVQRTFMPDLSWVEERALIDGAAAFADLDAVKTGACKIVLKN